MTSDNDQTFMLTIVCVDQTFMFSNPFLFTKEEHALFSLYLYCVEVLLFLLFKVVVNQVQEWLKKEFEVNLLC